MTFSKRRRLAYLALTLALGTVFLGGLAEAYLRLRWVSPRAQSTPAFADHPAYGMAPGSLAQGRQVTGEYNARFEHNALAMRGPAPTLAPKTPQSPPRLLLLGDSHTYGLGCEQGHSFADLLRTEWGAGNVANTGCNGYGTREQLAWLHHFGGAWQPDVVLLTFFWNDLEDNLKPDRPRFALKDGKVQRQDSLPGDFDPLEILPAMEHRAQKTHALKLSEFIKFGMRGLRYRLLGIKKRSIQTKAQRDEAWIATTTQLDLVKVRCEELGARLVIACLPDQSQVDPAQRIKNIEPLHYRIQGDLEAWCASQGIPYIDLLPPLKAAFERDPTTDLFYYADRHMTPAGHRIVAQGLTGKLATPTAR